MQLISRTLELDHGTVLETSRTYVCGIHFDDRIPTLSKDRVDDTRNHDNNLHPILQIFGMFF